MNKENLLNKGQLISVGNVTDKEKQDYIYNLVNDISNQVEKNILFFSLESSGEMIKNKIKSEKVKICDRPIPMSIELIKQTCMDNSTSMVIIDYYQLISLDKTTGTRIDKLSYITNELKNIALSKNIPVIVLVQLPKDLITNNLGELSEYKSIYDNSDEFIKLTD